MPVLTPYAAQEIAMVSSTPCGSGLPIGLMPGALPSDHASRHTLNTTAMRLLFGHSQSAFLGTALLRIFVGGGYQETLSPRQAHAAEGPCPALTQVAWFPRLQDS